jgi:hypothetical protein
VAQYKKNFYGSSYYGETNAFSGTYETAPILTEEALVNTFNVNIQAILPDVTYDYNAQELVKVGTWTPTSTSEFIRSNLANNTLTFTATCDRMTIRYQGRPDGALVQMKLTTTVPGKAPTVQNVSLDTNSASIQNKEYVFNDLGYGNQVLEMKIDAATPTSKYFYYKNVEARVCSFTIETRAATGTGAYTAYVPITITTTPVVGKTDGYTITGVSPNYAGKDHIQVRVWMASSDNDISPIIEELDTYAGNTNNRTEDGLWTGTIDMTSLATGLGVTFGQLVGIVWEIDEPAGTKTTIRTRGSNDATHTNWGPWTVPYSQGNQRLRIKETAYSGYIITPLVNPASVNPNLRIDHWVDWIDSSFLPPDEASTGITYEFLDESGGVIHKIDQPKYIANRTLLTNSLANKPFKVKITLTRRVDKSSPAVDNLKLKSNLIYEERKVIQKQGFSSVDNFNLGENMILDMSTLTWTPPSEATTPTYYLEDQTQRPRDVVLYLESTNSLPPSISRPNYTSNKQDKIWAKVNVDARPLDGTITGVYKHYQYGGGTVVLTQPDTVAIANSFTPSLDTTKEYRYFLTSGWFNPETGVVNEGTVNESISVVWASEGSASDKTQITEVSSHNAIVKNLADKSSDSIVVSIEDEKAKEEVEWVSEEKISFGTLNINNLPADYVRKHVAPESGESVEIKYTVGTGDTFTSIAQAFQMEEYDLRYVNKMDAGEPTVGSVIIVPPSVVLPKIDPKARVSDNPYEVTIVYNSVRQGTKVAPDDRIVIRSLQVEYEPTQVTREKVVRGIIPNGRDVLGNGRVLSITGIWNAVSADVTTVADYQEDLDYVLDGNFVDWSAAEGFSREPVAGASYYVSYVYERAKTITVVIGSDYVEQGGVNRVWRSTEVKEFQGTCEPGIDFRAELPATSTWAGTSNPQVEDLEYIIEDNDLWVKSWVEFNEGDGKYYAVGSLQDRIPKDNWYPTIQTGYYYAGKDEYYMFSEPIRVQPTDSEMARSANVDYVDGKFDTAALFQKASMNVVRNSGFEVASQKQIVQKITFGSGGTADLGITN